MLGNDGNSSGTAAVGGGRGGSGRRRRRRRRRGEDGSRPGPWGDELTDGPFVNTNDGNTTTEGIHTNSSKPYFILHIGPPKTATTCKFSTGGRGRAPISVSFYLFVF